MFVVLQPGGYYSYDLQEAIVRILEDDTCRAYSNYYFTDRMICTGYPYDWKGPCYVRGYTTNAFVCETFLFLSNTNSYFNNPSISCFNKYFTKPIRYY